MIDSRRHSVQKQLVLINELNQVAWIADLTTELAWFGVLIKLRSSGFASYLQSGHTNHAILRDWVLPYHLVPERRKTHLENATLA